MSYLKQVIVVRKDLNMRKGKIAAQVAHASMKVILQQMEKQPQQWILPMPDSSPLKQWLQGAFTKVVTSVDSEEDLLVVLERAKEQGILHALITDAGKTEFAGVPTNTCVAVGPDEAEKVDIVTGDLKLL